MANFRCRVMTNDGKIIEENFTADSKEDLLLSFQSRNYRPIQVSEVKETIANKQLGVKKLKPKSLILFCRQMATLLRSGVPLIQCFEIIASQTEDKLLKKTLSVISGEVQAGNAFSTVLERQGDLFPPMLSRMVKVGEITGDLTGIMERMASQYESDSRIKKKVKGAMVYPIAMLSIAIAACIFMIVGVVPRFVEIFESVDSELPLPTQVLLFISDFLITKWYIVLLLVPAAVYGIILIFRREQVVRWMDHTKLTFKPIRVPMQKLMCVQFTRTLHTLISSGIPIVQAITYANQNIKNTLANEYINQVAVGVQKGSSISSQLSEYEIFPKLLVSMISIGEASGNLEEMLSKTADYYDEELDAAISQLMTIIEPIMILVVGILIGGIVMSLYAPMFGIISAMSAGV